MRLALPPLFQPITLLWQFYAFQLTVALFMNSTKEGGVDQPALILGDRFAPDLNPDLNPVDSPR
jgi:hypothetical protein